MNRSLTSLKYGSKIIAPSLLAADFSNIGKDMREAAAAGIEILHIDVMDGHLVPNISMGQPFVHGIRKVTDLIFDTHLMISEPLKYIESFRKAGSDHITFHYESANGVQDVITEIRRHSLTVGISLKPATPPEVLLPYMDQIDMILVMTVEPGFGGQSFMSDMLHKISFLRKEIDKSGRRIFLQVDGGIDESTISMASSAGADVFVAGTSVFRHREGVSRAVKILENRC